MNSRDLFHSTFAGEKNLRVPFWIMRQAGRYLPEYRELKEKYSFVEIVKTPELSLEAALQPMRRFDFDCSILFSDILVVAEALGFPYGFKDEGGIYLEKRIESEKDVESLDVLSVVEKLDYVFKSLKMLRKELPQKAIIGFCASPFTLAAYMIEGQSSKTFPRFLEFMKSDQKTFFALLEKLSEALSLYAKQQLYCGIDAFQIFDSHGSMSPVEKYPEYSGQWIAPIISELNASARTILFANNMSSRFAEMAPLGADAYALDDSVKFSEIFTTYQGHYVLQGNLKNTLLANGTVDEVKKSAREIIEDMKPYGRHIFNLSHGITPDAKLENVYALCEEIRK